MDKIRRMKRIFREDGKTLVVAMDHGTFNGASAGLENPGKTIEQIVAGGADTALVNFGVARRFAAELSRIGYIAHLDLPPTYLGMGHDSRITLDAEYALCMEADVVVVNVGQGQGAEEPTYPHLSHAIQQYDEMGMPVCAKVAPDGFDSGKELRTLDHIARGARIACKIGCDFMKIGFAPGFERVAQEAFVPLIVLGGAKMDDVGEFFVSIHEAMDAEASDVAIGRNIWGAGNTVGMTRALATIAHENAGAEEAYEILQSVK